jgi:hypothetical protein
MATRRISWIDQRINGGVGMLCFLSRFGFGLFGAGGLARWRIAAIMAKAASPKRHDDANHARTCSRCERARIRSSAVSKLSSIARGAVRNAVGIRWRDLRQHEAIVLGGKVNWLSDKVFSERLPAINLAHVDLT